MQKKLHVLSVTTCYKLYSYWGEPGHNYAYHICMSKVLHKVTEKLVIISWLVIHFQQGGSPFNLLARQPGSPWVQITSNFVLWVSYYYYSFLIIKVWCNRQCPQEVLVWPLAIDYIARYWGEPKQGLTYAHHICQRSAL